MAIAPISAANPSLLPTRLQGQAERLQTPGDINISASGRPLELLYRSAIEKLNEYLAPEIGPDAIQTAADAGIDFSPEAVAERIVSFATAGFAAYATRHGDEPDADRLDGFMDLIGGAIEQGFEEAKEILEGLGVFRDQVAANANRTYDLMQEKLQQFAQSTRSGFAADSGS